MGWFDYRPGDGGGSRDEFDGVYAWHNDNDRGNSYSNSNNNRNTSAKR